MIKSTNRKYTQESIQEILREAEYWFPTSSDTRATVEFLLPYVAAWEFGAGQYGFDVLIHFHDDLSARAIARCMARITEYLVPSECRVLPPSLSSASPYLTIRLWWD